MTGFIKLHRQVQDHWIWSEQPACRGRAWIDLLMLAAYLPHKVLIRGQLVALERGELAASVRFLAQRWAWGHEKVAGFLTQLQAEKMLTKKQNGSGNGAPSVFSIVNYEIYQGEGGLAPNGSRNGSGTAAERSRNKTEKGKKAKNEERNTPDRDRTRTQNTQANQEQEPEGSLKPDFERFWKAYPRKVGRPKAFDSWCRLKPPLEQVLTAIEKRKRSVEWTKDSGRFIPHPTKWLDEERWTDEVPPPSDPYEHYPHF